MKKINVLSTLVVLSLILASCSELEETKSLAISDVEKEGVHTGLLAVQEPVKIMLFKRGHLDKWDIRVLVPFSNTMEWTNLPNNSTCNSMMHSMTVDLLDENGIILGKRTPQYYDSITELLLSDKVGNESIIIFETYLFLNTESYKDMKEKFDRVTRIRIVDMSLSQIN